MSQPARRNAAVDPQVESARTPQGMRAPKLPAFLITLDEALWPQIGPMLEGSWVLKQVDTVAELKGAAPAGQTGIVLFDAREHAEPENELSGLQMHSARFAIVLLDASSRADMWRPALRHRQIVAVLEEPFERQAILDALEGAREECLARSAVLDEGTPGAALTQAPPRKPRRIALALTALLCVAGAAGYLIYRMGGAPATEPATRAPAPSGPKEPEAPATEATSASDEQVDALLEKARQAMLDRHYIDPPGNNALSLYQNVLVLDQNNGEAHQGLTRLAQILFVRVQADLDERKFDLALQALETARSLSPDDPRLAQLDARIATLRAELGPAQIQAAINAKNFERALQLLDEAARAKTLGGARISQLREEVRRRQEESDGARVLRLLGARIQQERLIEPRNDSAVYYLQQARQAGASAQSLEEYGRTLDRKLMQAARAALDEHRLVDAERLLDEWQQSALPAPKEIAALRHDLSVAHDAQTREKSSREKLLELAKARLAQGELIEPDNDSALSYLNQLRAADPGNVALAGLSSALQSALVARARAAIDAGTPAKADSLAKAAATLGPSAELDALTASLAGTRSKARGTEAVAAASLVVVKPLKLEYPPSALSAGTEGWVDLAFSVTTEGKVANISVVNASPPNVFDAVAKSALARMRFRPVLLDGRAVDVTSTLRVSFKLSENR